MPSIIRFILAAGAAGAVAACQPIRVAPEPVVSTLIVRNTSAFDVNLYAVRSPEAKPIWLGTVAAAGIRSLPLSASILRAEGTFVVQSRAIGANSTWTSGATFIDASTFAILDLTANSVGDCSGSQLRTVPVAEVTAPKR